MNYRRIFNPSAVVDLRTSNEKEHIMASDQRDGKIYAYHDPKTILAINIALATGRPLLLYGQSGSGKSSVAFNVARILNRRYYEFVVTSRSQAQDLLWHFDAVRRLGDAQAKFGAEKSTSLEYGPYIKPGLLWWVYDRQSAKKRGQKDLSFSVPQEPIKWEPNNPTAEAAVILIDEIDKADPDFPNNLLVALGSRQFTVDELNLTVSFQATESQIPAYEVDPLVLITTNGERRLPDAFLRRCIVHRITNPKRADMINIAQTTVVGLPSDWYGNIYDIASQIKSRLEDQYKEPSVAEFMDAVHACYYLLKEQGTAFKDIDDILAQIIKQTVSKNLRATENLTGE